jgi:hypothetical protein
MSVQRNVGHIARGSTKVVATADDGFAPAGSAR